MNSHKKSIINVAIGVGVGVIWYFLIPDGPRNFLGKGLTEVRLSQTKSLIQKFEKSQKRIPQSLAELRWFSLKLGKKYIPYDGYGTRLYFKALSDDFYVLQSLGSTTLQSSAVVHLPPLNPPLLEQVDVKPVMRTYPVWLLEGARYKGGRFVARLIRNMRLDQKTLVIQKIDDQRKFWLAPHPNVEEFFWLGNSKIIFSASGDSSYEDGIFVWDLKDQSIVNLLKAQHVPLASAWYGAEEPRYLLSLASYVDGIVYAFVVKRTEQNRLMMPHEFFSDKYLYEIRFDKSAMFQSMERSKHGAKRRALQDFAAIHRESMGVETGNAIQKDWVSLPLTGDPGAVIDSWQSLVLRYPKSPIFPYGLFYLSYLYHDAAHKLNSLQPDAAAKLDAMGGEVARALMGLTASPTYIRALGEASLELSRHKSGPTPTVTDF